MKSRTICVISIGAMAVLFTFPSLVIPAAPQVPLPSTTKAKADTAGPDLIASFYKALIQEAAPTAEQEKALFYKDSGLRTRLLAGYIGNKDDPVLLQLFRKHKDRFLPAHFRSLEDVRISTEFQFYRGAATADEPPPPGNGLVLATFAADRTVPGPLRSVVFRLASGKIEPDAIKVDGFDGKYSDEVFKDK